MMRHIGVIYQRPAQGGMNGFLLKTVNLYNYVHRISALGGFNTANASVQIPISQAQNFATSFIGCVIRVFVDNPCEAVWEGLITRATYNIGGVSYTISTDETQNRVKVTYFDANAGTPATTATATSNNTTSQAIYGVLEGNFEAGVHFNSANTTHLTTLRNTMLLQAYPRLSLSSSASGDGFVEIEMQGLMYYTFDRNNYASTDTTLTNAGALFQRVTCGVDRSANASSVIEDSAAYPNTFDALIQGNSTFQMTRESRTGQSYLQFIQSIVEAGDGTQQWTWGITAFDRNRGTRRVYYRPASTTVAYTCNSLKDYGRLRTPNGTIIPGWKIRPDAVVRVVDLLAFPATIPDNPQYAYIQDIEYDGNSGLVSWQSGDNITMEGAIGRNRYFKKHGVQFNNSPVRLTR